MEIVKKFGLWIVAGVIAIGALVIYFVFVQTVADQVSTKRDEIEKRRNDLKTWAQKGKQIPNPTMIAIARENAKQVAAVLDQCELYLARQPRWAHTIRFFTQGPFGPETEVPLDHPNDWLKLYLQYNQDLQNQVSDRRHVLHGPDDELGFVGADAGRDRRRDAAVLVPEGPH